VSAGWYYSAPFRAGTPYTGSATLSTTAGTELGYTTLLPLHAYWIFYTTSHLHCTVRTQHCTGMYHTSRALPPCTRHPTPAGLYYTGPHCTAQDYVTLHPTAQHCPY
jgi:hypothetical protein